MNKEKISILLAEDDRNLGNLLREYLEAKANKTEKTPPQTNLLQQTPSSCLKQQYNTSN